MTVRTQQRCFQSAWPWRGARRRTSAPLALRPTAEETCDAVSSSSLANGGRLPDGGRPSSSAGCLTGLSSIGLSSRGAGDVEFSAGAVAHSHADEIIEAAPLTVEAPAEYIALPRLPSSVESDGSDSA